MNSTATETSAEERTPPPSLPSPEAAEPPPAAALALDTKRVVEDTHERLFGRPDAAPRPAPYVMASKSNLGFGEGADATAPAGATGPNRTRVPPGGRSSGLW